MKPILPPLPSGFQSAGPVEGASFLADWIFEVSKSGGQEALDYALSNAGWPGTKAHRALLPPGAIEKARNEAIQQASWK